MDRRCTFLSACLQTIQKPGLSILFCQSRPSMYQCEKSFTPCGNGLSPVLDLQKRKWPMTLYMALEGTLQGHIAWLVPKGNMAISF